jgi:hypothetical protein
MCKYGKGIYVIFENLFYYIHNKKINIYEYKK